MASREKRRKGFSHAFPEMLVDVQFEQSPAVAPLHSEPKIAKIGSGPRAQRRLMGGSVVAFIATSWPSSISTSFEHFCANLNESPAVAPVHSEPKIAKMGSGPRARMASAV